MREAGTESDAPKGLNCKLSMREMNENVTEDELAGSEVNYTGFYRNLMRITRLNFLVNFWGIGGDNVSRLCILHGNDSVSQEKHFKHTISSRIRFKSRIIQIQVYFISSAANQKLVTNQPIAPCFLFQRHSDKFLEWADVINTER